MVKVKRILRETIGLVFIALLACVVIAFTPYLPVGQLSRKLLWAAVGVVVAYWLYRQRQRAASKWPTAEAVVVSGRRAAQGTRIMTALLVEYGAVLLLDYYYEALDEFYAGSFALAQACQDEEEAREQAKAWLGRKIFVRYNPRKPDESLFLELDGAPKGTVSLGSEPPDSRGYINLSLK